MDTFDKICLGVISACVLAFIVTIGGCTYQLYTMTPEEKSASLERRQIEIQEDIENNTHRYEVINVFQYVRNNTNRYGGVISSDIITGFSYIASDGTVKTEDIYYGSIAISDKDEYVVCISPYNRYCQLYLTKETMSKMQTSNAQ